MQRVSFRNTGHRPHHATAAAALLSASATLGGLSSQTLADCPWIVQPSIQAQGAAVEPPAYEIVFDGLGEGIKVFYGFTVASVDLAWQLASQSSNPELRHARRLHAKTTAGGRTIYQLASDTIEPYIIYLVAANSKVDQLEVIDARIEPSRPIAVSQMLGRTRGASDMSGALPHRSVPGVEIASAAKQPSEGDPLGPDVPSVQICAYQVAMR
jgi:hypothetical protein